MAQVVIKSAFVEDNKGFVLKIAEPHSKKNDRGGYDTVSRTFFDVKVSRDSGINLDHFVKGSRIAVTGNQKTEVREHEGKKYYTLTIWADRVEALGQAQQAPVQQSSAPGQSDGGWATPGDFGGAEPF